jgi:hypothetical protein
VPSIHTDSVKPRLGPDSSYPLGASDLEAALEPHLTDDLYLSLRFHQHQAARKNDRDRIEALGDYRLLECRYARGGSHLADSDRPNPPWAGEDAPQVILAEVFAVPRSALVKGVGLQKPLSQLLSEALSQLAATGIPSRPAPRDAWILELGLDARVHAILARLRPWNGGEYAVARTIEVVLPPVGVKKRR